MKKRKKFRRRTAIEPVIGHLKKYFKMGELSEREYFTSDKRLISKCLEFEEIDTRMSKKEKEEESYFLYLF